MRLASCVFLLVFSLQLNAQPNTPAADFSITLDRSGCLGFCPWYSVTILGDGSVRYEGKAYVHVEGTHKKTIPVADVNKLTHKLRDEDFFHWGEKTDLCVDYPEVRITASLNGQRKQVLEGCSAPGKVLALAEDIDIISGTKYWVGNVGGELIQRQRRNGQVGGENRLCTHHLRLTPKVASAASNDVSHALIGKQITVRGKLLLGKIGWYMLLDNQQEIYFFPMRSSDWGSYAEMRGKLVTATGILRFFQCPKDPPTDKEGRIINKEGRVIDRCSDYFYFEAETAQVQLVGP